VKFKSILRILFTLVSALSLTVLFFLATEYINVGVMGNTKGYPWGCKCLPNMDNYASPEIYVQSLIYGMLPEAGILFGIYLLWKYLGLSKKLETGGNGEKRGRNGDSHH